MSPCASASIVEITVAGSLGNNAAPWWDHPENNPDSFTSVYRIALAEVPSQSSAWTNAWISDYGGPAIISGRTALFEGGQEIFAFEYSYGTLSLTDSPGFDEVDLLGGAAIGEADFLFGDSMGNILQSTSLAGLLDAGEIHLSEIDISASRIWAYDESFFGPIYEFNTANGLQVTSVNFQIYVAPSPPALILSALGLAAVAVGRRRFATVRTT